MTAGIVPNAGEVDILTQLFSVDHSLHLFKSNTTPGEATVSGDLTEADFTGYSSKTIAGGSGSVTSGDPSFWTGAAQTFTGSGAAQTVYGYFIKRVSTGVTRWVRRFDTALSIGSATPSLVFTPKISLKDSVDA